MSDCVFCDIIDGKVPCAKVYEDDHCLAFLNIKPEQPNHTLLIPKIHYRNVLDCDPSVLGWLMGIAQSISQGFRAQGAKAIKIVQNNEAPLQEVFHLHFHIIPYWEDDK